MAKNGSLWFALIAVAWFAQTQTGQAACVQPSYTDAERKAIPTRDINQAVLSKAIAKQTNYYRCTRGLKPLAHDVRLMKAAEIHARNMARMERMEHSLPVNGARTLKQRFARAGVSVRRVRAENIGTEFRLVLGTAPYVIVDAQKCHYRTYATGKPVLQHSYGSLARSMVQRWWHSAGHRQNMLVPGIERVGAAARFSAGGDAPCGTYYISQDFAG